MDELQEYRIGTAHRSLEHIRTLKRRKDAALAVADEMTGIKGIDYAREYVSASASDDAIPNLVAMRKERHDAMEQAVEEYDESVAEAWERIQTLEINAHVQLLTYRYIKDWEWERVAVQMAYSYENVMVLRRAALLAYYDVMPIEDKRIPSAI